MFSFIEQTDNKIIAKQRIDILIDKELFESEIAYESDSNIVTLGIFKFRVYESETNTKLYNCILPINMKLNVNKRSSDDQYIILSYDKNDIIVDNTVFFKNVQDANKFLNWLTGAKLDLDNFEDLVKILKDNTSMHGIKFKVQSVLIEAMASEMIRYKKNEAIPFRMVMHLKNVDKKNDYFIMPIKDIARTTSVFNALSFEDIKKSMQASVLMTRSGQAQRQSPVETVLKY